MPREEEKEEEDNFIEYPLISQAFCPALRQPLSLSPHADPVREALSGN